MPVRKSAGMAKVFPDAFRLIRFILAGKTNDKGQNVLKFTKKSEVSFSDD
jgi:hypothetical protein